jgi:hypothetical protein
MTLDAPDCQRGLGPQLWWLRLDPDAATIAATGRVIVPDLTAGDAIAANEEERLPCVGTARDGTLMLAYLARGCDAVNWDLRVAPIAAAGPDRPACVLRSSGRKLAEGCIPLALHFSADGRWVYASLRDESLGGAWGTLHRYAVPDRS